VVAQRRHEHYKVIRKMIGKFVTRSRRTYAGLLIATNETNRSYIRWSISAPSYADLIDRHSRREGVRLPHHQVVFRGARLPISRRTVGTYAKEDIVASVG